MALSNEQMAELKAIQEANAAAGVDWEAGETDLLKMTPEDRLRRLGVAEDPNGPTHQQRREAAQANYTAYLNEKGTATETPTATDWRNYNGNNFISPIKNQGGCGSCVAFGVAAALDGAMRIAANLPMGSANAGTLQDLSEAQFFFCGAGAQGRTCGGATAGWWIPNGLAYAQATGIVPESTDPYTDHDQACGLPSSGWQTQITQIAGSTSSTTIAAMKNYLATSGPMITQFEVFNDFWGYKSGVYKWNKTATSAGWHCVAVVGYDDTLQAWICKNSWGTGWGDQGYFKIAYGQCSIDAEMWASNAFNTIYPYPTGNTYTLSIDNTGTETWSPHDPNTNAGWLNGDQLIINCSLNLNAASLPPASAYIGLTLGAACSTDTVTLSRIQATIAALSGEAGMLEGTGITTGSPTALALFYGATSKVIPTISLTPAGRGTLTNTVYQWTMTYNGNNTVVGNQRQVGLVFGFGYRLNGIIN